MSAYHRFAAVCWLVLIAAPLAAHAGSPAPRHRFLVGGRARPPQHRAHARALRTAAPSVPRLDASGCHALHGHTAASHPAQERTCTREGRPRRRTTAAPHPDTHATPCDLARWRCRWAASHPRWTSSRWPRAWRPAATTPPSWCRRRVASLRAVCAVRCAGPPRAAARCGPCRPRHGACLKD